MLLCLSSWASAQSDVLPSDPFPEIASSYLVEINGVTVWGKQPSRHLPPASLTKMMTALLVVEQDQLRATARISPAAARESGSRLGLKAGDQFHVAALLAAALIGSANDACHALADFVGGNEARFVQRMNQRAKQLGMRDTHFVNACGHDALNHYSSARDLALLANELLKHSEIIAITSLPSASIDTLDGTRSYSFDTKNALIGRYSGALGLKTGHTPNAGNCLVAYAERRGEKVLLVMLHGNDRWWDAVDLLDLAFDHASHPS